MHWHVYDWGSIFVIRVLKIDIFLFLGFRPLFGLVSHGDSLLKVLYRLVFGHGLETNHNHQGQANVVGPVDVDKVAVPDWGDPLLVDLDDFCSVLLDGEVVLEDRSVNLPVVLATNLDDKVVSDDADRSLLDLGNLVSVTVLDGHRITDAELAFLDPVQGLAPASGLEIEGLSHSEDLVVRVEGGSSPSASAAHLVDGKVITEGQEFFAHRKGLGPGLVVRGRIVATATAATAATVCEGCTRRGAHGRVVVSNSGTHRGS